MPDHTEGMRVYLEEPGDMVFDEELGRNLVGYVSYVDPRSRFMGTRIVAMEGCVEGEEIRQEQEEYKIWRIIHGVCEGEAARDSNPEALNFQLFNGKHGDGGGVFSVCGMVCTDRRKDENQKFADTMYRKKINGMRVIDKDRNMIGVVYESVYNLALIQLNGIPSTNMLLENGDKINIWEPHYIN